MNVGGDRYATKCVNHNKIADATTSADIKVSECVLISKRVLTSVLVCVCTHMFFMHLCIYAHTWVCMYLRRLDDIFAQVSGKCYSVDGFSCLQIPY